MSALTKNPMEIIATIRKKEEEKILEDATKILEQYLETHPEGRPNEYPLSENELDAFLEFSGAIRTIETIQKKRKKKAASDALDLVIEDSLLNDDEENKEDKENADDEKRFPLLHVDNDIDSVRPSTNSSVNSR